MKHEFLRFHPLVSFLYFAFVIVFSMFFMHPVCIALSLLGAALYLTLLRGIRALRLFALILPLMLITAALNPLFNHSGATILTYFPSGNPLTLESIAYGGAAAGMLACVVLWFSCYGEVMTSDKFMYLFSRVIPSLSLVLSMILRFVPRLTRHAREVAAAQTRSGRGISSGPLLKRIRHGAAILSSLVTWSLENSVDTSDSMRSRGYGLRGRTAFSTYRFSRRDLFALAFILISSALLITGAALGAISFDYFPSFGSVGASLFELCLYFTYFLLCALPLIIETWEAAKWRILVSKM